MSEPVMTSRYVAPDWFTRNVFNQIVAALTRLGISVWGSRVLEVRGRKTGKPRRTSVNLLTLEGTRYLVAPRGHTQWVRNLRAAGEGELLLGRRRERFVGSEVADDDKEPILRAYLKRWKWEVGQFFGGVDADSPSEELRRIAADHPIFRIEQKSSAGVGAPGTVPHSGEIPPSRRDHVRAALALSHSASKATANAGICRSERRMPWQSQPDLVSARAKQRD